jgi:nucleoside-diphosphate-sugar epimerase/predicted dehydrogenase
MSGSGDQRLKVGILGTGYIAEWHIKALRQIPTAQIVAAADVDLSRAQSTAAAFRIKNSYASLEAMLAAENLDVVHVLTPPQTHYSAASTALEAGVHVMVEKPMCIERSHCVELEALAASQGVQVGVNHNFLFTAEYERLRTALADGAIGRIDHVMIVWNKPLGQLSAGPFNTWMLRRTENIILEIGPHLAAHLLDLVGYPEAWQLEVDNPVDLPSGCHFYRRWRIAARIGKVAADLHLSFQPGFSEHYIHIRGTHGTARLDFENQTLTIERPTHYGPDFDRYFRTRRAGSTLRKQARTNLLNYILSKLKLSDRGNAFGSSIQQSLKAFYGSIPHQGVRKQPQDSRMSPRLAVDVIGFCEQLALEARQYSATETACRLRRGVESSATSNAVEAPPRNGKPQKLASASVLVLGGTGFIGKELVQQLLKQHYRVRILSRSNGDLGGVFRHPSVEFVRGGMSDRASLEAAVDGVDYVIHLARAHVKRWEDYYREDVMGTKLVAEVCQQAGVRRLIYTGTIDSYYAGHKAGVVREETGLDRCINRRNYYARAKYEAEALLLDMHRDHNLPVVIMRPGIVMGPGGSPFHWGVGMWSANSICQVWGDGDHTLPIVLVSDVAAALITAMTTPDIEGQSFNLVGEPVLTARQYVAELERCLGVKLDVRQTPIWKFYLTDMGKWLVKCLVRHPDRRLPSYRDWESRTQRAQFDCTKAKHVLKWKPTLDRSTVIQEAVVLPAAEIGM